jgi:hypothetical protein
MKQESSRRDEDVSKGMAKQLKHYATRRDETKLPERRECLPRARRYPSREHSHLNLESPHHHIQEFSSRYRNL